jgi:hypothetical protein
MNEKKICFMDDWDDDKIIMVKRKINHLIWMHADSELTLAEAEERACAIVNIIREKARCNHE